MLLKTRNFFVRCCLPTLRLEEVHDLFEGVRDTVRFPPSQTARVRFGYGVGDFNSNRLGINAQYPVCSCLCRDLVVTTCALYSARKVPPEPCGCCELLVVVVVVVVVVVGPYSTVTGNGARWFHGSTPRDDVGRSNYVVAHIAVPLFAVACTGGGERPPVSGDASPLLGGDAPPDEGSPAAPGKHSAGDAAPGEGEMGARKFLLMRSRSW